MNWQGALQRLAIRPILVDIGASDHPPTIWDEIAPYSIYIGFDPDDRALNQPSSMAYARTILLNEAVTEQKNEKKIGFYLTRSPLCSSSLLPNQDEVSHYLFAPFFDVVGEQFVPASTLETLLAKQNLTRIDWLKIDTQGTDLRLFESLPAQIKQGVLALDVEPGLINAYQGEDLFVETHAHLIKQGFWLSRLEVKGAVRCQQRTVKLLEQRGLRMSEERLTASVRPTPGWCEARYLRTISSLHQQNADASQYQLLWVFSLLDGQFGYALDIAHSYESKFGASEVTSLLYDVAIAQISTRRFWLQSWARRVVPSSLKKRLSQLRHVLS